MRFKFLVIYCHEYVNECYMCSYKLTLLLGWDARLCQHITIFIYTCLRSWHFKAIYSFIPDKRHFRAFQCISGLNKYFNGQYYLYLASIIWCKWILNGSGTTQGKLFYFILSSGNTCNLKDPIFVSCVLSPIPLQKMTISTGNP